MLGIRYPVFQGGMAWVADGKLAAAVSEGGGLGIIGAGNAPASYVREQIRIVRSLTQKPFGVNIMLLSPFADEVAAAAAEEKVAVVPGPAFGPCGEGFVRCSYAASVENIRLALERIGRFMTRHHV